MGMARRLGRWGAVALAATGSIGFVGMTPVHADTSVTEVGGGAAAIRIPSSDIVNPGTGIQLFLGDSNDAIAYTFVNLPSKGSDRQLSAKIIDTTVGPVTATIAKVTTQGNLIGSPYAESTSTVSDLTIAGTNIAFVYSECRWDSLGATAQTQIRLANGQLMTPAPNTPLATIPGVGSIILNRQYPSTFENRNVISVVAVDIIVAPDNAEVVASPPIEIQVGFSSCDPSQPPTREQTLSAQVTTYIKKTQLLLPEGTP